MVRPAPHEIPELVARRELALDQIEDDAVAAAYGRSCAQHDVPALLAEIAYLRELAGGGGDLGQMIRDALAARIVAEPAGAAKGTARVLSAQVKLHSLAVHTQDPGGLIVDARLMLKD